MVAEKEREMFEAGAGIEDVPVVSTNESSRTRAGAREGSRADKFLLVEEGMETVDRGKESNRNSSESDDDDRGHEVQKMEAEAEEGMRDELVEMERGAVFDD